MKRSTSFRLLVAIISMIAVAVTAGCSHKTPYYRNNFNLPSSPAVSTDNIRQRVLLIGDTGEPADCEQGTNKCNSDTKKYEPVLELMREWASEAPEKTFSIFLGDNIYEYGLTEEGDKNRKKAQNKLEAQHHILTSSKSRGIFLPGNHDWGGRLGPEHKAWNHQLDYLKSEHYVVNLSGLEDGCPGPVHMDLNGVRIIVMDTQWWLTRDELIDTSCSRKDEKSIEKVQHEAGEKLTSLLQEAQGKNLKVIVATHHPLITYGNHGGFFSWQDHLKPPIIGSLIALGRSYIIKVDQDTGGARYKEMQKTIREVYSKYPPLIHAAGHDHSLQIMEGAGTGSAEYNLVSGAGSKAKLASVTHGDDTLFAHEHTGFMVIDLMNDSSVLLRVVEPGETNQVVYSQWLKPATDF